MPSFIRDHRDELRKYLGKKVTIGTTSYHYISGRAVLIDENDHLKVAVGDGVVLVAMADIATIQESPDAQAEYVK